MVKLQLNAFEREYSEAVSLGRLMPSPCGRYIAFSATEKNVEQNKSVTRCFVWDKQEEKELLAGSFFPYAWQGNNIIFLSHKDAATTVCAVSVPEMEQRDLFTVQENISEIWPISEDDFLLRGVHDYNPEGEGLSEMWVSYNETPFRANNKGFTSLTRRTLFRYKKGVLTPITAPDFMSGESMTNPTGLVVADGYVIHWGQSYTFDGGCTEGGIGITDELWRYDLETGENVKLHDKSDYVYHGGLVHGGRVWLTGTWERWDGDFNCNDILSMLPDGSDFRRELKCEWSLGGMFIDGDDILLNISRKSVGEVWKLLPGEGMVPVLQTEENMINACAGGYYVAKTELRLPELYHAAKGRLTGFNGPEKTHLGKAYPIRYIGSDGFEIEGWVVPPRGYEPGKKYPGVLNIHGGPQGCYDGSMNMDMRYFTENGFFAFYCNPRGSSSYGRLHMQLEGECGVHDYKNCMEFTDEVLKAWPDIDASRLAVTGRSYGGYMTNWIIGHTDRFKAAVSIVSISNWISYHGCSDYTWFGFWENDSTPWQDVDKLWWHSPIKYANKCTTPTLFIQNEYDFRCPLEQAEQMFTALCQHRVPSKLLVNYKAAHGGLNPVQNINHLRETVKWMEKYTAR